MIEHYSHKIQNAIQKELFKAKRSIKIAVAWFTNDLLFQPLLLKLYTGITVEIILNKDEINCSNNNDLDFAAFVKAGGVLRWNDTTQLLHVKFCIIDDNVVIYGSYNWTNKAEYNEESITIAKGEKETITFYCEIFDKLSMKFFAVISDRTTTNDWVDKENHSHKKNDVVDSGILNQSFINQICSKGYFPLHSFVVKKSTKITSTVYKQIPCLNFYDKIICSYWGDNPVHIIAQNNVLMCLLDNQKLVPIDDLCFSDYKFVGDIKGHYFPDLQIIWLKIDGKWGLYNKVKRRFGIPPICDDFHIHKQIFDLFEIVINSKHGIADAYGNIVLDWVFDEIEIREHDLFEVKINNVYALIKKKQLKIVYDERTYRGIAKSNGKYGLISYSGDILLDLVYDKIEYYEPFGCGYYVFYKNGKCGLRGASNGITTYCVYNDFDDLPIDSYYGDELVLKKGTPTI